MKNPSYYPQEPYYLYVVLTNSSSVVSKLINMVTRDQFTHASVSLDRNLEHMFSFSRVLSPYPFWGGFKQEKLRRGFYARNKTLPGAILQLEVSREQYARAAEQILYFNNHKSQFHYDIIGLLGHIIDVPLTRKNRYTCSKFVANVLEEAEVYSFEKPISLVRPQDFLGLPAQVIYCGDLKQYARSTYLYQVEKLQQQII